ncbi:alpha/beta hydrolase [Actinoplanes sp. NBRC 101535]|uniref:alpha/beta fold hydrolase n=1 Tax=Actinoplanes sp. NBRC 101535 TaxID=3032196 RepID=UPI0024A5C375|nr:alpha/beta hydrolase [Actinoplanes sp. NBRC 101535]GLY08120.1 hydrolase [Actinoplanes sp. NBRC 101535]
MYEIVVDGVRQAYHVAGRGPVCVAHPGGPGLDASYLRSAALEEHFTMVYVDPAGTGGSGRPPRYGMDVYTRSLGAVVDHLGDEPVYLLGHSAGGFVTQAYALAHPGRVAGHLLYSTAPAADQEFWAGAMAGVAAYPQRHPDVPEAAHIPDAFRRAQAAPDDATMTAAFREALPVYFADFWSDREAYAPFVATVRMSREAATAADPVPFDVRGRLAGLTAPAVVITGRHDFIGGPRWGEMLAAGIPGARHVTLEHSGHFAHIEEPDAFVAAAILLLP